MPELLRVEGLRALDVLVAEKVMGWPILKDEDFPLRNLEAQGYVWDGKCERIDSTRGFRPASVIADAWEADEKARAEGRIARTVVVVTEAGENFVTLYPGGSDGRFYGSGGQPTLPLALCVAHLRAVGLDVELAPEAFPDTERSEP